MRVRVDRQRCSGFALCIVDAPTVFEIDEQGKAVVLDPIGLTAAPEDIWDAARDCPSEAIILEDEMGNVLYP